MPDTTLQMLLNDVRGKTLRLLDGITDAEASFAPPGLHNSVLWHAGHVLVVNEHLGLVAATGQQPACPAGWFEMFSWSSKPATVSTWPALADIVARLKQQQTRLAQTIEAQTPEQLDRKLERDTVRHSVLHGLHDEACHQGEIWLLRKLWKNRG